MAQTHESPAAPGPLLERVRSGLANVLTVYPSWESEVAALVRNLAGVVSVGCVVMSIVNGLLRLEPAPVLINLAIPVFILAGIVLIRRSGRFTGAFLIMIVGIFLVIFPVGFFTTGGLRGTLPYYFLIGVAVTSLMLQGLRLYLALTLEIGIFVSCVGYSLSHPWAVEPLPADALEQSLPFCLLTVAIVIALVVHSVYRFYLRSAGDLATSNDRLREAAKYKDAFLATAAHELKTPMAIMSTHAQEARRILGAGPQSPEELRLAQRDLEIIINQAESLSAMVSQLLDLSRISEGRLTLAIRPVALAEVLQSTLAECAPLCAENGNQLRLTRGGAYPRVMADAARISRVLFNLIANATRHTREGTITISVAKEDRVARVTVADTGEGMTQATLEAALRGEGSLPAPPAPKAPPPSPDAERRLAVALAGGPGPGGYGEADAGADQVAELVSLPIPVAGGSRHGGLGLGLRLVRHIVEAHGGEFTLESRLGLGTSASFTLPLAP